MGSSSTRFTSARRGPAAAVERAEAIFIGGGNTFRLLDALWRHELDRADPRRVRAGMPYIGSSAGSNVACVTIKTTNDMPIVQPPTFDALKLVPFNINPHYLDPVPGSTHMGETREERIAQFHEENPAGGRACGKARGCWSTMRGDARRDVPARGCSGGDRRLKSISWIAIAVVYRRSAGADGRHFS